MKCKCGKPAYIVSVRMCKACYMVKWHADNPTYQRDYHRHHRQANHAKPKDALKIFCDALGCDSSDIARYILALRCKLSSAEGDK